MHPSSQTALPQDPLVPRDPTFAQTGGQTTLSPTTPSRNVPRGTAQIAQVLRDQICLAPICTVPSTEIHQALDRDGQADLELRSPICRLQHLSLPLCLLSRAVCAKRP